MTVNGQLVARSPADELLERLDDPVVAAALNKILDHVDLLALLIGALGGFFERGETIVNTVADGVRELRGATEGGPSVLADLDLGALATSLAALARAASTLDTVVKSPMLTDQRAVSTVTLLGEALIEARQAAAAAPAGPTGLFSLLRMLRDEDVSRGLGLMIETARALGRKLA